MAIGASGGIPGRDGVSTGAHLHFEVRDASGLPLDPASVVRLPESAHGAPRWASSRRIPAATPTRRPPPPTPLAPEALDVQPEADSLASTGDLPDLVLPDYPTLPALQGIPQP